MSTTPRTDNVQHLKDIIGDKFVSIEFARQLERELAEALEQRDRLKETMKNIRRMLYRAGRGEFGDMGLAIARMRQKAEIAIAAVK